MSDDTVAAAAHFITLGSVEFDFLDLPRLIEAP
jgi:hypothetical protein